MSEDSTATLLVPASGVLYLGGDLEHSILDEHGAVPCIWTRLLVQRLFGSSRRGSLLEDDEASGEVEAPCERRKEGSMRKEE